MKNKLSILPQEEAKEIKEELERTVSILASMVDLHWEGSLYEQLDTKLKFENTLYAFKNLILAESLIQPVIIELEDTHWIDSDSQEIIKVLTRNIDKYPIAIVSVSRYKDDGSKFKLDVDKNNPPAPFSKGDLDVGENRDTHLVHEIDLSYLSEEGIKTYGEQILNVGTEQCTVDEELVRFLKEKTNGNPFFIEQLLLDLKERGIIKKALEVYSLSTGSTVSSENVPSNITAVLISRLDRLKVGVKQVVQLFLRASQPAVQLICSS